MAASLHLRALPRLLALLALAALVSGCGLWTRDTTPPPSPLPELEAMVHPQAVWSRDTGSGSGGHYLQLSPHLAEDRVVAAGADGRVSAWTLEAGERLWETRLEGEITAGVGGGEGVVVVGTGEGRAVALDLEDGQILWRQRLSSEVMAVSGVDQGVVVVRTNDGHLYALDAETGETGWMAGRTTPALSLRGAAVPLLLPGRVAAGFDDGRVTLLGLARGNVLWETRAAVPSGRTELDRMADVDGRMAYADGVLYVAGYQGRVMALSISDGRTLWQRDLSSHRGLTLSGDRVLVTDAQGRVWALDRNTGGSLWQQDRLQRRGVTVPAVVASHAVVGDAEGYLHWLSLEDGRLLGRVRGDSAGIMGTLRVRDGTLYALGRGGELTAVRLPAEK
ncbi:Beta-barrel assembly machine subunit BamB [Ectothiorhodospira mobilis]|uniref:Outer membrane protein assembly factor BamB n=1 Tax=Ectothiorhodospira mobilis TaxID=195064 RepID=A0A1I4QD03_ECTMO|nr:outer membrane protein assembly factor BamB [Ectothiorhodospira mobilis]SFM37605.1 Beta-barrel assembly machine subunit BamB [Ectothiorhodospira mobilis]